METSSSSTSRSSIGIFIIFMALISLIFHANDLVKATHNSTSSGTPAVGEGRAKKVVGRNGLAAGKTLQHEVDDENFAGQHHYHQFSASQLNAIVKLTMIKRLLRYFSRREWEGGVVNEGCESRYTCCQVCISDTLAAWFIIPSWILSPTHHSYHQTQNFFTGTQLSLGVKYIQPYEIDKPRH